jgi:hypothetical protein
VIATCTGVVHWLFRGKAWKGYDGPTSSRVFHFALTPVRVSVWPYDRRKGFSQCRR